MTFTYEIIKRAIDNPQDAAAQTAFVNAVRFVALNMLRARGFRQSDIEDIVQDTTIRAWSALANYDYERSSPSTWVRMICHSIATDFKRRSRVRSACSIDDVPVASRPEPTAHDIEAIRRECAVVLSKLEPGVRDCVVLRFGRDASAAAVANALQIPRGTVSSRCHRARRSILEAA